MHYFADLHFDGVWRAGSTGERFPVVDPSDGSTIAEFAIASEKDCLAAVDAADAAQPGWAATPTRQRAEMLRPAFEILTAEEESFAEIMVRENGKSWPDAICEASYATEFFRWFSEETAWPRGRRYTRVDPQVGAGDAIRNAGDATPDVSRERAAPRHA